MHMPIGGAGCGVSDNDLTDLSPSLDTWRVAAGEFLHISGYPHSKCLLLSQLNYVCIILCCFNLFLYTVFLWIFENISPINSFTFLSYHVNKIQLTQHHCMCTCRSCVAKFVQLAKVATCATRTVDMSSPVPGPKICSSEEGVAQTT